MESAPNQDRAFVSNGRLSAAIAGPRPPMVAGVSPTAVRAIASGGGAGHGRFVLAAAAALSLTIGTLAVRAQTAPARTGLGAEPKEEVSVMSEFKVYDKKPVPFTDANMDIPRGVNDVQPYYIISAEEIENSGKADLEDMLKDSLTQNTVAETNAQIDPNGLTNQMGASSNINLRGLGSSQTLILINGQRTSNFGNRGVTYQPDTNGIPLAAIERVEVLPGSASAIYGGTAVGGMVNIILRRNYVGGQFSTSYQNTASADAPIRTANFIFGFAVGGRTHVTLSSNYSDAKPVYMKDRSFLQEYFKRAVANGPAQFYTNAQTFVSGATPNIALNTAAVNGNANAQTQTLTLDNGTPLGSRITYIPYGTSAATPTATLYSGLLANAGRYNLDFAPSVLRGFESSLSHVTRKKALMARVDHKLSNAISLFADFSFRSTRVLDSYWVPLGNGNYQFAVPGNAPSNPFRENVWVSIPLSKSQASPTHLDSQSSNLVFGGVVKLPAEWRAALDCNYSVTAQKVRYGLMNLYNTTAFGGDAALLYTGTLNPFVDTIANPLDVTRYYGDWRGYNKDTMLDYNARVSGPIFALPAGRPVLTVGTEIYSERLPQAFVGGIFPPFLGAAANPTNQFSYFLGQRISTYAGHAEVSVPIISGRNERRFVRALEFQAAVRTEEFRVYTNPDGRINVYPDSIPPRETHSAAISRTDIAKMRATKPTFGLKYTPFHDVALRVSYATAFLPPTFAQLTQRFPNAGGALPPTATGVFYDPETKTSYASLSVQGNNPDLGPETATNWNIGLIWDPSRGALKDFRFNLEYFRIEKFNLIREIGSDSLQVLANLGDRAPPGSVTRDPATGRIELFTYAKYNIGDGVTEGWDLSVDYRRHTPIGLFALRLRGTLIEHLKMPPSVGFPALEYVGYVNSGGVNRLKSNGSLNWSDGKHWRAAWSATYYSSYKQANSPGDPVYLGVANPTLVMASIGPQGGYEVTSQIYHNLSVSYAFGTVRQRYRLLKGLSLQCTVNNVFNTLPPFDAKSGNSPFFYSRFGNVRLRDYIVRVKKDF